MARFKLALLAGAFIAPLLLSACGSGCDKGCTIACTTGDIRGCTDTEKELCGAPTAESCGCEGPSTFEDCVNQDCATDPECVGLLSTTN